MRFSYFQAQLYVLAVFSIVHFYIIFAGSSHISFVMGVIFSLIPLLGPFAGFLYLVDFDDINGIYTIASQVVVFGYMISCHPLYKKSWAALVSGAGALLWCSSGFFYLYVLST